MNSNYLKISGYGLLGDSKYYGPFRQIFFEDCETGRKEEFLVYKSKRPMLWSDIEKLQQGKTIPNYRGSIKSYNGIDLVVFENESLENAFEEQKWKYLSKTHLTYDKAEKMRAETRGYITNLTKHHGMEIAWHPIDKAANKIKFRTYKGKGRFNWTDWILISK